jgi:SAM-dependent methyltransferase
MTETPSEYDRVAYGGKPAWQTHPNHIAALAWLHGLESPPVSRCRVLELGTGNGANLIPMAYQFPQSEFIGIDLSGRAIERAQANAADLGLTNIHFRQLNIMDIGPETGVFDYIIAHGVYSWVPPEVRTKILSVFRRNLARSGVAFVSYNCHPWSFMRDLVRSIMLFHVREMTDVQERVAQARKLLQVVAEMSNGDEPYGIVLRSQLERVCKMPDWLLYHDDLLPNTRAFFLYEVVQAAGEQGLQYLGEAKSTELNVVTAPEKVRQALQNIPEDQLVLREQYHDFISGRGFRSSLFCHMDVTLGRPVEPSRIRNLHFAGELGAVEVHLNPTESGSAEFKTSTQDVFSTSHALSKAALLELGSAWPRALTFRELVENSLARLGTAGDAPGNTPDDTDILADTLSRLYSVSVIRAYREPPQLTTNISVRPAASLLARKQAESQADVSTLNHNALRLDDDIRRLLPLVDGSRTVPELVRDFAALMDKDKQSTTRDAVETYLTSLAKLALLIA